MRSLALLLVTLFLLACGPGAYDGTLRPDVSPIAAGLYEYGSRATGVPPPPRATSTWECSGPVYDCSKDGEKSHCEAISSPGYGDSEKDAREEGVSQCEADLGSGWKCKDGSKLSCKKSSWSWKCAGPVPGCKCTAGPGECTYVEGYGDKKKYAVSDALRACEEDVLAGKGCTCKDGSQLTCTEGEYPTGAK